MNNSFFSCVMKDFHLLNPGSSKRMLVEWNSTDERSSSEFEKETKENVNTQFLFFNN